MIALLITLADFPDFVPFSVNISPLLVTHCIRDAHTLDVGPLLSTQQWAEVAAYVASLAGAQPVTLPTTVPFTFPAQGVTPTPALVALWADGLRPLLVYESARRMLLWHGAHVTANGLETISDIGHAPISTAQRTELRGDLLGKCSFWRAKTEGLLRAWAPTPATRCTTTRHRPTGGFQTSAV